MRPQRPGETLSLASFGLSPREREFALERIGGRSVKEIGSDHGVAASTVRNALSSAYRKLGITGSAELAALGATYKVE
jgi:DNA-binding CsgD family transcriptional regulator